MCSFVVFPCRFLSARCKYYFDSMLAQRGYTGSMTFDHKNETLSISVRPHSSKSFHWLSYTLKNTRHGRYSFSARWFKKKCFWCVLHSSAGAARPRKQGRPEWHALSVRRRALLLHCLLRSLSLGHHRGAFPLSRRVWCLHGNKRPLLLESWPLPTAWNYRWVFSSSIRTWWTGGYRWTWCWRWPLVNATDSSSSWPHRAWGMHSHSIAYQSSTTTRQLLYCIFS